MAPSTRRREDCWSTTTATSRDNRPKTINAEAARRFPESEVRLLVQHHAEHQQDRQPGEGVAQRTVFRDSVDDFHKSALFAPS